MKLTKTERELVKFFRLIDQHIENVQDLAPETRTWDTEPLPRDEYVFLAFECAINERIARLD